MQELIEAIQPIIPLIPLIYIAILFLIAILSGRILSTLLVAIIGLIVLVALHCYILMDVGVICSWIPLCPQLARTACIIAVVMSNIVWVALALLVSWIVPKSKKGR